MPRSPASARGCGVSASRKSRCCDRPRRVRRSATRRSAWCATICSRSSRSVPHGPAGRRQWLMSPASFESPSMSENALFTERERMLMARPPAHVQLSVVIPVFNEEPSLDELHLRLSKVLVGLGLSYEIVFVDDGSSDGSYLTLSTLCASDPAIRIVKLARNYGQTAALAAGFDHAVGEVIVAMDAD